MKKNANQAAYLLLKALAVILALYLVGVGLIGVAGVWVDGPITIPAVRIIGSLCLLIAAGYISLLASGNPRIRTASVLAIWALSLGLGVSRYHVSMPAVLSGVGLSLIPTLLLLSGRGPDHPLKGTPGTVPPSSTELKARRP